MPSMTTTTKKAKTFTMIRVELDTYNSIKRIAKKRGQSLGEVIKQAVTTQADKE